MGLAGWRRRREEARILSVIGVGCDNCARPFAESQLWTAPVQDQTTAKPGRRVIRDPEVSACEPVAASKPEFCAAPNTCSVHSNQHKKLTQIVAQSDFGVQACAMQKTSDIIWQDAQHQVLFEILDLLKEPAGDRQLLCKLDAYIEYHFALEEQYMLVLDYPGRIAHEKCHAQFRQEIAQLVQGEQELDAQFRELIATFLTEWLSRHVFGIDKELEDYILQSSAK